MRATCKQCKQNVAEIWDANADRWKLQEHEANGQPCILSGATVTPGGGQIADGLDRKSERAS